MKTFVKALAAFGAALMVAAVPATAASAETTVGGNSGWVPFQTPSFTLPAGVACSFELHGEVVYDHEFTRVLETFPDGSPKVQEFQGALGVVFTNVETGGSARRDGSGTLRATRDGDGGTEFVFQGDGIAGILAGSPLPGVYVVSGHNVLVAHPDGSREFTVIHGTLENMCQTLA
ncbi:hypothetical protein [Micromonospora coerulea]|uniref:hypothetical protein n=1 Tax=Micromonospora coerulea TaxID=47856 RepID=UPI001907569C|nr:hypothetical protein [Micromonospora veneta]